MWENNETREKMKVLFLCTGNSCRSQMAEGWCRHLKGDIMEAFSAGIETHGLNPNAVKVMAEAGVDISGHRSKLVDELLNIDFDYVITVCGHANEHCPFFPGKAKVIHVGFDDPPKLAEQIDNEQEKLNCYRRVRDEIRAFVESMPERLDTPDSNSGKVKNESKSLLSVEIQDLVGQLEKSLIKKECRTCDCFQGFLTQIEIDCPEVAETVSPLKVSAREMHGCLGCEPCPPGALFAQYLLNVNP